MSPSYDPSLGLFFVSARETCQVYFSEAPPAGYKAGDRTMGGRVTRAPQAPTGALRAIDAVTGERKWEIAHPAPSWAGVLSTASGVVFSGTNEGEALAADSRSGKELWRYMLGAASVRAADNLHDGWPPVRCDARGHDAHGLRPSVDHNKVVARLQPRRHGFF